MRALSLEHRPGRPQEDLYVEPRRPDFRIPKVKADHLIELDPGSTFHLP